MTESESSLIIYINNSNIYEKVEAAVVILIINIHSFVFLDKETAINIYTVKLLDILIKLNIATQLQ
jgi:hypothetical protein